MTTTTLTAINGQTSIALATFVAFEGFGFMVTDADPNVAAVQTVASDAGYSGAIGGLEIAYNLNQQLDPWQPFDASQSSVTLTLHNAPALAGCANLSTSMFKREADTQTVLAQTIVPDEADIVVKRSDDLGASGTVYIGCEAIGFTANDTGTDTLTSLTRGKYSPFKTESGGGFGRTHYATPVMPGVDLESTTSTAVALNPLEWRGKWVGVWLSRVAGTMPDSIAQSHRVFAGKIAEIEETEDGKTLVHCIGLLDVLKETVILRQQWRARLREGIWVAAGTKFKADDKRDTTPHTADPLVVVAAGATPPYQMDEGFYSGFQIAQKINAWLAQAKVDGDLALKLTFSPLVTRADGTLRDSLAMSDPTAGNVERKWSMTASGTSGKTVRILFGWGTDDDDSIGGHTAATTGVVYSDLEPLRLYPWAGGTGDTTLYVESVVGSFVDQSGLMPVTAGDRTGFLHIGDGFFACDAPSITDGVGTIVVSGRDTNTLFGVDAVPEREQISLPLGYSNGAVIEVAQVLCLEESFAALVLSMLASTGGDNWTSYERLPEHCSAAIPFDLLGNDLASEIAAAPCSDDVMRVLVTKPTRLPDLWNVSFVLRHLQFIVRVGRLALTGFATPTSAASLTIAATDRAAAINVKDSQRAVTRQSDEWLRNVITIRSGASANGSTYAGTTTIEIPGSVSNNGGRTWNLDARNAVKGAGSAGEDVDALLPAFIAPLAFLAYPVTLIQVPIPFNLFERATPGTVCLFSDEFARNPSTGARGFTGKPALVIATRVHGWGGSSGAPTGEVGLMLFPRLSLAPYCPCAQVDDTATNAGYNAGTKVLTCYAHEHSEAGGAADASYLPAGSKLRVMEIDPSNAAAPLTWDDVAAAQSGNTITMTTGLGGWDNTKRYRVYSDDYTDATTSQRANAYQADDADGKVADARDPYGLTYSSTGQVATFTASAATELAERIPTGAYGDGVALDTGHARALARTLNNLVSYGTAPQYPEMVTEMGHGGVGTWDMVYAGKVYFGPGQVANISTRVAYVGPTIKSTGGTSQVRVTMSPQMPASQDPANPSRVDVVRQLPTVETTFSTASATYATATPVGLDIALMNLNASALGGWAWIYVEVTANAKFRGFGHLRVGPLEAA